MRVRLVLCLPTYNEIQNLESMVRALGEVFAREGLDGRLLVIDDASPDGTGELADRLAAELPYVEVLHREAKQGLGRIYRGFGTRGGWSGTVMEMDCILARPDDVAASSERAGPTSLRGGTNVPGGRVENWGGRRPSVSALGRSMRGSSSGDRRRDLTGGFKCFRRGVLERSKWIRSPLGYTSSRDHVRALRAGLPGRGNPDYILGPRVGGRR